MMMFETFKNIKFHPVVILPNNCPVLDLTSANEFDSALEYSIGKYNEKRLSMYQEETYTSQSRNIHMGIDLGAPAGKETYAFYDGEVVYAHDNAGRQDYGPTLVTKHIIDGLTLYALWGHLSKGTLELSQVGRKFSKGDVLGFIGNRSENGGWTPHLHLQLSIEDPGKADMPGVVNADDHEEALKKYPDPRIVLGPIY